MTPDIRFNFHKGLDTCDIIISQGGKEASFSNLRVKKTNLRDWNEPQVVYQVFIPCRKALGRDYMLCAGMDAIFGRQHPERKPLVLTIAEDLPKRKKKSGQLVLFGEDEK